jgi:hypothetical protein
MASVTDSSKRHGAMGVDFLSIFIFGLCVARGDAPLSGALVKFVSPKYWVQFWLDIPFE